MALKIEKLPEFDSDFKKLLKRYRTLEQDLHIFIAVQISLFHELHTDNGGIVQIPNLGFVEPKIYKARKFACRALGGTGSRSGIRIIYAYFEQENRGQLIEIYYKGDKKEADRQRIACRYPPQHK
jgi:hypothetical protein